MDDTLRYQLIGDALFRRLDRMLRENEHISLLGPRQGAMSLVLDELTFLARNIPQQDRPRILRIAWKDFASLDEEAFVTKVAEEMSVLLHESDKGQNRLAARLEDVFRAAVSKSLTPWWIFVQDIIGFAAPIARELLQAFQSCYGDPEIRPRLAVLVTGSADFIHLTYEATSPYRHARKLIALGMDKPYAARFFCSRRILQRGEQLPEDHPLSVSVELDREIEPRAFDLLYEATAGSFHLLQELVIARCRYAYAGGPLPSTKKWTVAQTKKAVKDFVTLWMPNEFFSRTTVREIEHLPETFDLLLRILRKRKDRARILDPRPCQLEILGVATRDDRGYLFISCPVWREFFKNFLDKRQEADVYARQQRWDRAWALYSALPQTQRDRPLSGSATFRLRMVLSAWERSLMDRIAEGTAAVWKQFSLGAQHLLGFESGGIYNAASKPLTLLVPEAAFGEGSAFRPETGISAHYVGSSGMLGWVDEERLCVFADPKWRLRFPPNTLPVLALTRKGFGRAIDSEVQKELWGILELFWQAYRTAHDIEYQKGIGEIEERFRRVIARMNECLFQEPVDMGNVVRGAADALVEIGGYLRILVCLVDPERERIQGVASRVAPGYPDFPYPTDYGLDNETKPIADWDVHPWVVSRGESCIIQDGASPEQRNPTVNYMQGQEMSSQAITVVPMKVGQEVIGTVHFERRDKQAPSDSELRLFESLAAQLAVIFHQAERLTLLQQSLHALPDKVRIIDPKGRVLFLNTTAQGDYPECQPGWQRSSPVCRCQRASGARSPECLMKEVMAEGKAARHYERSTHQGRPTTSEMSMAPLDDFRNNLPPPLTAQGRIGYVERLHDLTDLYDVVDALQEWLAAKGVRPTARKILDFFQRQGFKWCRIYLLKRSEGGDEWLESFEEFGLQDHDHQVKFRRGDIQFFRREPVRNPWHVFEQAPALAIYEHKAELATGVIEKAPPFRGWPRYFSGPNEYREELERQDLLWLEAPLLCGDERIGIISLSNLLDPTPSKLEILKIAVTGAAGALDDAIRAEGQAERAIEETWKMASAQMVHQLVNKLAPVESRLHYGLACFDRNPKLSQDYMERAERAIKETRFILRDYQRYASDKPFKDAAPAPVPEILERAKATIECAFPDFGSIECEVEAEVRSLRLEVSLSALDEILDILARNSQKHNVGRVSVSLGARRAVAPRHLAGVPHEFVCIVFRDSGKGIPLGDKDRVFDPFVSSDPLSMGLGLAIARRYIRRHKGEMLEEGTFGQGACFNIYLPVWERGEER